jgi:hypothetical protein
MKFVLSLFACFRIPEPDIEKIPLREPEIYHCEICGTTLVSGTSLERHLSTKLHAKRLAKINNNIEVEKSSIKNIANEEIND